MMRSLYSFLLVLFLLSYSHISNAEITLETTSEIGIGADLEFSVLGEVEARTFVTLVPVDTPEGKYAHYVYAKEGKTEQALKLKVLGTTGDYELRVMGPKSPYPTLARKAVRVIEVTATIKAPQAVDAGTPFAAEWDGPDNNLDYISIAKLDMPNNKYLSYRYTQRGSPAKLTAPEESGEYEIRYVLGSDNTVIGSTRFTVGSVAAAIDAPQRAAAGSVIEIDWEGPDNPQDFITIVKSGAAERSYEQYVYTQRGNPAKLRMPETSGAYEIRYLTGQKYSTLAQANIEVTAVNASVTSAAEAVAGSLFDVQWEGPGNDYDYITIVEIDAPQGTWQNYTYTNRGSPLKLRAPEVAGQYEIRYATGVSHTTLATTRIQITPAAQKPGRVFVSLKRMDTNAVEVILDASGSMLKRIGEERRIDIAKSTLAKLTAEVIPEGTPFALRVFGREIDSCQTDLVSSLAPLDADTVASTIASITAKNNAKTPIADSLAKVTEDLAEVSGQRLIILLTDGEETCAGDPATVIQDLASAGTEVRINIIGFAIDDNLLESTFALWSKAGNGDYFSAKDSEGLDQSLRAALQPGFIITDNEGETVAEGITGYDRVSVMPGEYVVRLKGTDISQSITVVEDDLTSVEF